ncbi:MAG: hypothetical protein WBA99_20170 [Nodosilinea sp.]
MAVICHRRWLSRCRSVSLTRSNLSDAVLVNTILLWTIFEELAIAGADSLGAILDGAQARQLCQTAAGGSSIPERRWAAGSDLTLANYSLGREVRTSTAIATKNPT